MVRKSTFPSVGLLFMLAFQLSSGWSLNAEPSHLHLIKRPSPWSLRSQEHFQRCRLTKPVFCILYGPGLHQDLEVSLNAIL